MRQTATNWNYSLFDRTAVKRDIDYLCHHKTESLRIVPGSVAFGYLYIR